MKTHSQFEKMVSCFNSLREKHSNITNTSHLELEGSSSKSHLHTRLGYGIQLHYEAPDQLSKWAMINISQVSEVVSAYAAQSWPWGSKIID